MYKILDSNFITANVLKKKKEETGIIFVWEYSYPVWHKELYIQFELQIRINFSIPNFIFEINGRIKFIIL